MFATAATPMAAKTAYVVLMPTDSCKLGSTRLTAKLDAKLTKVARAMAWLRTASGNTSPTMSQLMGPNEIYIIQHAVQFSTPGTPCRTWSAVSAS